MVRLPRPENTACTVRSGTSPGCRPVIAHLQQWVSALAAIIDGLHKKAIPRNALPYLLLVSCPLVFSRTHLYRVFPRSSCAGDFALAMHTLQNQGAGLSRPLGAVCAALERRLASMAAGCPQPGHITS
jgi:hypothetical protein